MKKLTALLLLSAMLLGLFTGCGTEPQAETSAEPATVQSDEPQVTESPQEGLPTPIDEESVPAEEESMEADETPEAEPELADASNYASLIDNHTIDPGIYLDYSAGIEAGVYKWILDEKNSCYVLVATDENGKPIDMTEAGYSSGPNATGTVYQGVYINANITNLQYQTMLVYVPMDYMSTDDNGNVVGIDYAAAVGSFTADTAPIVYWNECGGWRSSQPGSCNSTYTDAGMIYVAAGARSRNAKAEDGTNSGKAPTQAVDLKSGVIQLRANRDVIPGNTDCIVSAGGSGAGEMSSVLGASGNMPEYYEYMYNSGVLGVTINEDGTFSSAYPDNIYAAQCFCPIADIENADLAYAWWWCDLTGIGGEAYGKYTLSPFKLRLQELEAEAFVDYINSLGLEDSQGNSLTLTGIRSGSYYDAVLTNLSNALNAKVGTGEIDPEIDIADKDGWLVKNEDGTWSVTDLAGFMVGTGLINNRGKNIPGFDTFGMTAENDAFGYADVKAVHYSSSVAAVLEANYEELSALEGFEDADVDEYIQQALYSDEAEYIDYQVNLMNATELLLGNDGLSAVDPAPYWRVRSGTADQHTSFTIGYDLCLAAAMAGCNADYHLVWNMGHGNNEGTSTGTMLEWIIEIHQDS